MNMAFENEDQQKQQKNKKVVGEVAPWLKIFDDGSVDRTWTGPTELLPLISPVPPYSTAIDGLTVHDLPSTTTCPPLRLYLPSSPSSTPLPVILHFHGGGFCFSRPSWLLYHHFYSRLARLLPAIVISPTLPLAPEQRLPAAADAAFDSLLFLRDAALSPPPLLSAADFSRVFLLGDSSGGSLVHHVASRVGRQPDGFLNPIRLLGGIILHPGFVRASRSRSELENPEEPPFLTLETIDKFLAMAVPAGATKDHPYTCPMGNAAPPMEELRLPPMMVAVAERDLMRDTNLEYYEAMKRAEKQVRLHFSKEVGHSFYLNPFAVRSDPVTRTRTQELIEAIKNFIDLS